ncbi:hypothetical protein IL992_22125 [Microbispora sp. NEAU-D428]|nr:hypothetical protein [Microbispora sitophila]MBE3011875.1 hypothetical protein [Microbispora sitophila]
MRRHQAVLNAVCYVLLNVPAQIVPALLLALALNRRMRGGKALRRTRRRK